MWGLGWAQPPASTSAPLLESEPGVPNAGQMLLELHNVVFFSDYSDYNTHNSIKISYYDA